MAFLAPSPAIRRPFAELGTPRLQSLSNIKNRQNGIVESSSAPAKSSFTFTAPVKRQHSTLEQDSNPDAMIDTENIDPEFLASPSKRSKTNDSLSLKTNFSLSIATDLTSALANASRPMATPRSRSNRPTTPPFAGRLSTPAGRSPTRGRYGRSNTSLFKRIDPPGSSSTTNNALPFSLDAALSATLGPKASSRARKPMPKSWTFDIYEDTPEQEATNLMEHYACTLDISDDEGQRRESKNADGKENVPPPDYVLNQAPVSRRPASKDGKGEACSPAPVSVEAKSAGVEAMHMDAAPRSPLLELAPEDHYAAGLDAASVSVEAEEPIASTEAAEESVPISVDAVLSGATAAETKKVADESTQGPISSDVPAPVEASTKVIPEELTVPLPPSPPPAPTVEEDPESAELTTAATTQADIIVWETGSQS